MNNSDLKKKRAAIKFAILGGVLFATLTVTVIIGHNYFGRGQSGEPGPDTFIVLESLIGKPTDTIIGGSSFDKWLLGQPSELLVQAVTTVINMLLGSVIFLILYLIAKFITRKKL